MADLKFTTNAPDLTGQRFSRLLVLGYAYSKHKHRHWLCRCDCGQEKAIAGKYLTRGTTKSCGCLNKENIEKRQVTPEAIRQRRNKAQNNRRSRNLKAARAYTNAIHRARRAALAEKGLCVNCGKQPQRETSCFCQECHLASIANHKKRVYKAALQGLCTVCMKAPPEEGRKLCRPCLTMKAGTPEKRLRKTALKYGITDVDYKRMLEEQNGVCAICQEFHGGRSGRLDIDHCHVTGKVRGLLCHKCNRALGLLKERIENLQGAIAYLERHTVCLTLPSMQTLSA
jgi:hypothetical protein